MDGGLSNTLENDWRARAVPLTGPEADILPSVDAEAVARLLALCPRHAVTPLIDAVDLAAVAGVARLWIKDERARMGLGSFKALGAAYAIAREAAEVREQAGEAAPAWEETLKGRTFATASAGNHGLSVAAGARLFGAQAVIYLAKTVPEAFAERLRAKGAEVVRAGADYEASMAAAQADALGNGWTPLSDSSWQGYMESAVAVMEGYLQLAAEAASQIEEVPTHILLQAGVGGLAAAVAAYARHVWGDAPRIVVVEPEAAPALIESIRAGHLVDTHGPESAMGRLDCKTPSLVALNGLVRDADLFVTISEEEAAEAVNTLADHGYATTPSGGAGLAALLAGRVPGCGADARVLAILSEGPEDG
ncbi:pyridoxal-phosphate dependent enzyme [Phaeobacter sp. PT47_59]|uniref:pyridoxal-phosphate dependent enzyme n=1 Tax=Phaeobacter sp. PT47_59 TaxID=3029979 RepID=UPI0023807CA2|nr:pyridoxal-phosphate dependent enzyme [Phaeobacter sp. PT47_59]MDE4173381.1 pyridoxal-phosphate dependent enzyme [Phaeobacter sp. PT47_59]